MERIDNYIYQYRFYIGGILIFIILTGSVFLVWDKVNRSQKQNESQTILNLQAENEKLRQELSSQSKQLVAGAATESQNQSGKININTADAVELDKIPGIGPARAADIINYRETHNGFKTIEEMKNIKGIGDKTFESMKHLITVGN